MCIVVERGLSFLLMTAVVGLAACGEPGPERGSPLFVLVSPDDSGVTFANMIREDLQVNILSFEYLYNGGGVAVGDVTGDSLPDLFFTATQGANRL